MFLRNNGYKKLSHHSKMGVVKIRFDWFKFKLYYLIRRTPKTIFSLRVFHERMVDTFYWTPARQPKESFSTVTTQKTNLF